MVVLHDPAGALIPVTVTGASVSQMVLDRPLKPVPVVIMNNGAIARDEVVGIVLLNGYRVVGAKVPVGIERGTGYGVGVGIIKITGARALAAIGGIAPGIEQYAIEVHAKVGSAATEK